MERNYENLEDINKIFHCETCNRDIQGIDSYKEHLKSKKHNQERKQVTKKKSRNHKLKVTLSRDLRDRLGTDSKTKLKILKLIKGASNGLLDNSEAMKLIASTTQDLSFELSSKLTESEADRWIALFTKEDIQVEKMFFDPI